MTPARPSSSPTVVRMKSLRPANLISSGWPMPRPVPDMPPVPKLNRACADWSEVTPGGGIGQ